MHSHGRCISFTETNNGAIVQSDLCTLTFLPYTTRYEWTLCFLGNIFIWEDRVKHAQVMGYTVDLRYTPSLFLTVLLFLILFPFLKDNIAGFFFFFTNAPFCAESVTNCCRSAEWPGSLWVMSSQSCLRVVLPPRHISAYPHHRDVTEYSLVSLTCSFSYTFFDNFI